MKIDCYFCRKDNNIRQPEMSVKMLTTKDQLHLLFDEETELQILDIIIYIEI